MRRDRRRSRARHLYAAGDKAGARDPLESAGARFRIAGNLATDHARHQRIRERFATDHGDLPDLASSIPQPDALLLVQQEHALLKQAIAELPEKRRTVFLLRTSQELSYGQIASRLGISVSAVEKHMSKAILHCRARMERHRNERPE